MFNPLTLIKDLIVATINRFTRSNITEKEILEWLRARGFGVNINSLSSVRLYAIKRPGWTQVFRFEADVRFEGQPRKLFGAFKSDERFGKPEIYVSEKMFERDQQLRAWSEGMIVRG